MDNLVVASPTKKFFVSMLTRDIELKDAILDLLDNCVDGVLRILKDYPETANKERPYSGFWAKITANPDKFEIHDNCGGISRELALGSAFRLGRIETNRDRDIATVGMYGIGMKRAIFKMGQQSKVTSRHKRDSYFVEILPDWLADDKDWDLKLVEKDDALYEAGTQITITQLYPNIGDQFNEMQSTFLSTLRKEISSFYALIMKKGFSVFLNDEKLEPEPLDILFPRDFRAESISPYAYTGEHNNVNIELFVGFYRSLATDSELDEEMRIPRKKDNAGWTVICNDRVVLHRDKSQITGWGDNDVPKYHNQFIAIAGVIRFHSNEPLNLPLNTTKRGLDTSSPVYWHTRRFMQEGLKKFTDFTNHWKGREEETSARFDTTAPKDVTEVIESIPEQAWKNVRGSTGRYYAPELPRPPKEDIKRRIVFLRLTTDIEFLGRYFFGDPKTIPSAIGERAFDEALQQAKEEKE